MSRIPTDNREIRTYPDTSVPEVEPNAEPPEIESDEEVQLPMNDRLLRNIVYMEERIKAEPTWVLTPQTRNTSEGVPIQLIVRPTASLLYHNSLNPYLYRTVGDIPDMNHLATLLRAPLDWQAQYDRVFANRCIADALTAFMALPDDTPEITIEHAFVGIVSNIAILLGLSIGSTSQTKVVVGGPLAKHEYDLRSSTDTHFFKLFSNIKMIASEAKTKKSFPPLHVWYNTSRGVQVFAALYAHGCPTFLYTQDQWKIFVENDARNAILTYPFDYTQELAHTGSVWAHRMGPTFIRAIVICLLSTRNEQVHTPEKIPLVFETPQTRAGRAGQNPSPEDQPAHEVRRSARLKKKSRTLMPSFLSGYKNGVPVYSDIRVYTAEEVAAIDEQIETLEKQMRPSATSESINTLVQT